MLLDVHMPEMGGLECVKALRNTDLRSPMKVIMVTSEADNTLICRALDNGADEFLMKPFTLESLRGTVYELSGRPLTQARNPVDTHSFESEAQTIARPLGSFDFEEFVHTLQVDRTEHLHRAVAEAQTVHETCFFRDPRLFDVLRETVLPRLIGANSNRKTLRIWSAATSTGQEAYSIAMLLREHFAELADWDVNILGTDLSLSAIDYARRGRYRRNEVNRGLPARKLVKYLTQDGEEWEIAPALRSMCEFRCAGLCGLAPKQSAFDLVLLRNVLLYLPAARRSEVFRHVRRQIAPGGYLVLGASEQAEDSTDLFHAESSREYYFYSPV